MKRRRSPHRARPAAKADVVLRPAPRSILGRLWDLRLPRVPLPKRSFLVRQCDRLTRLLLIVAVGVMAVTVSVAVLLGAVLYPCPLAIGVVMVLAFVGRHGRRLVSHGQARFASFREIAAAGRLLEGDGIPVGDIRGAAGPDLGRLFDSRVADAEACQPLLLWSRKRQRTRTETVRLNGAVSTITVAPPGAGKTTGQIVPYLRSLRESCVVIDAKGEIARLTAAHRMEMGQEIVLIDPFGVSELGPSSTLNPLSLIRPDDPLALDKCKALGPLVVVKTGQEKDPHWDISAEDFITTMAALVVFHGGGRERSFNDVRSLLSSPESLREGIDLAKQSTAAGGLLSELGHKLDHYKGNELGSVLTTATRHLSFAFSPAIAANLATTSFDPSRLRRGKMTVYVIVSPQFQRSHASYLRLIIGSILNACVDEGLEADCPGRCHFVLDDTNQLGKLECLTDALNYKRGYGVRLHWFIQSLGQLAATWPEDKGQAILSACDQTYFAIRELATAQAVVEQLGEYTAHLNSGGWSYTSTHGHSQGGSSSSVSRGTNANVAEHGRKLMRVDDLMSMDADIAITFAPNSRPILTRIVPYFARPKGRPPSRWRPLRDLADAASLLATAVILAALLAFGVLTREPPPTPHRGDRDGQGRGATEGAAGGHRQGRVPGGREPVRPGSE